MAVPCQVPVVMVPRVVRFVEPVQVVRAVFSTLDRPTAALVRARERVGVVVALVTVPVMPVELVKAKLVTVPVLPALPAIVAVLVASSQVRVMLDPVRRLRSRGWTSCG
jgi:hypothetical protein